jgi:hypothetical protein
MKLEYDISTVSVETAVLEAFGCRITVGPFGELRLYVAKGKSVISGGRTPEPPKVP